MNEPIEATPEETTTEPVDPIETVHAQLDDLTEHVADVKSRLPVNGPVTLNRWRIIDGSLGELIDQIKGIRATAKEARK